MDAKNKKVQFYKDGNVYGTDDGSFFGQYKQIKPNSFVIYVKNEVNLAKKIRLEEKTRLDRIERHINALKKSTDPTRNAKLEKIKSSVKKLRENLQKHD